MYPKAKLCWRNRVARREAQIKWVLRLVRPREILTIVLINHSQIERAVEVAPPARERSTDGQRAVVVQRAVLSGTEQFGNGGGDDASLGRPDDVGGIGPAERVDETPSQIVGIDRAIRHCPTSQANRIRPITRSGDGEAFRKQEGGITQIRRLRQRRRRIERITVIPEHQLPVVFFRNRDQIIRAIVITPGVARRSAGKTSWALALSLDRRADEQQQQRTDCLTTMSHAEPPFFC